MNLERTVRRKLLVCEQGLTAKHSVARAEVPTAARLQEQSLAGAQALVAEAQAIAERITQNKADALLIRDQSVRAGRGGRGRVFTVVGELL